MPSNEKAPVDSREYGENQWLVIVTFCELTIRSQHGGVTGQNYKRTLAAPIKILGLRGEHEDHDRSGSRRPELSDVEAEFPIVALAR